MKMIVGLGNPGKKYAETRHNVGFKVIDMLGGVLGIEVSKNSFGGLVGKGEYAGNQVLLLKPMQYMNLSGQPVADVMGFYKIDLKDVLVVLDDMWLEPGQIRLRAKGSAGGHNGLTDVVEKLGTEDVPRLRVGIGQCRMGEAVEYVLGEPGPIETEQVNQGISRAKDAAICWLEEGIGVAMTKHNSRLSDGQDLKD
ncbi:MAG: aminoacyl-tRNA hydrolase [Sedimentisphaerales bacterium]|jgi:PTH1 family peptidyl-tRNA hydrolase